MDLNRLFQIQSELDKRIVKEHGLEGRDLLDKKILALQVELGECANEWRGFKFWSKDQEPRVSVTRYERHGEPKVTRNLLLEEYVDCLHFVLSIGLEHEEHLDPEEYQGYVKENDNIVEQFHQVFKSISDYEWYRDETNYYEMACQLLGLGEMLGFTEQQIEQAYMDKNKVNHERQNNGY